MKSNKLQLVSMMAKTLRAEDREEVCAARGIKNTLPHIKMALLHSAAISPICHFFFVDAKPTAVLGLVPQSNGSAIIWMLACHGIEQHIGDWMRWFIQYWDKYKTQYSQLYNAVYAKNASHLKLVERLNCRIGEVSPNGFIPFWSN